MNDLVHLERLIADVAAEAAGPSRPVDVAAVTRAVAHQAPKWRFQTMFSATKFVVAGAIVALFGGFLLAGVLTQPGEVSAPAASTASASPFAEATTDATAAPEKTTRSDILPGVDLVTEEVEPGMLRVVSDGVRDLSWEGDRPDLPIHGAGTRSIAAGPDGSVWLFWPDESFRLGEPRSVGWGLQPLPSKSDDFEIGPDGTVYRVSSVGDGSLSYLGGDFWTYMDYPQMYGVEAASDGTLWGVWPYERWDCMWTGQSETCASYVSQLFVPEGDPDSGHLAPALPKKYDYGGVVGFWVTEDGGVWLWDRWEHDDGNRPRQSLTRFDGSDFEGLDAPADIDATLADMAPDGTLWAQAGGRSFSTLARFDGSAWTTFDSSDGVPDLRDFEQGGWGFLVASPDGSVWVTPRGDFRLTGTLCDGIMRFDGATWDHYLEELCIIGASADPDGRVWLLAADGHVQPGEGLSSDMRFAPVHTYVITPQAVAASD